MVDGGRREGSGTSGSCSRQKGLHRSRPVEGELPERQQKALDTLNCVLAEPLG